jgi:hypothetical protein
MNDTPRKADNIQFRPERLFWFINGKLGGQSRRMAVIHGKALLKVNRKNLLDQTGSWDFG